MAKIPEGKEFPSRAAWRRWLAKHHDTSDGIWLIYYKKHTGIPSVTYTDAVEEALCFGWIDAKIRRLDDQRYMQRYTPRNPKSLWSNLNKRRVAKLIDAGLMTDAGQAKIDEAKHSGVWDRVSLVDQELEMPAELAEALAENPVAQTNFDNFAPSYRKAYIAWVMDAKREETRQKRITEVVKRAVANQKPGMM